MSELLSVAGVERDRLVGLAYRLLGTIADAEDAVQEAFVRWYRLDERARADVANPVGWFAKTTSRVCLDVLKSASRRHDHYVGPWLPEPIPGDRFRVTAPLGARDPAEHAVAAESVSMALLVVMESMTPAERVAFVLRDVFDYPVADIADVLDRSPGAVRQLASSARARIGASAAAPSARGASARLTEAFRHAANTGDVAALVRLLDPGVTLRSDGGGVARAALNPVHSPDKVARFIVGVLARQAPAALAVRVAGDGVVLTFERDGTVTGVVELVTQAGVVRDVLIQWNPHKLTLWRGDDAPA
ncbi:sigma-70 family RNA polymerase sigma factor [Jiangella sp. DSM 45060]|uniref:sigma-70 family RNA polymerase sigma factor n=1 Tax=Jiangella sp. DSM 45060 TaxID=1798224 RepID=UPI00087DA1C5|nr:sigma-70 family RNA polymerase sigma factor [Jiangella sp. DSM 45060]SDS49382.1 RNA polymerase sigma-70 factor, ECF subfamily [Jiangella sp. DSM 45060]